MVRWFATLALAFGLAAPALAAGPSGPVRVIDADTIEVAGVRVRLHGIDAPERDQTCTRGRERWACGRWATLEAERRLSGRRAECDAVDRDRHGRVVAVCRVGGRDVAEAFVRDGLALADPRFSRAYLDAERAARREGAGIAGWDMVRPRDWRAGRAAQVTPATGDCRIKGNISSNGRIYHLPGQTHYDRTRIDPSRGERMFCTEADARAAGWRAARR